MNLGFYVIMAAQFFSSLADNALLVAAIALLMQADSPSWLTPYLKFFFAVSYVLLAPYVGAFADRLPKGTVMFISNTIKIAGCGMMLFEVNPLAAYALVGHRIEALRYRLPVGDEQVEHCQQNHARIVARIAEGDARRAESTLREHVLSTEDSYLAASRNRIAAR